MWHFLPFAFVDGAIQGFYFPTVVCNTLGVLNALEADRESLIDLEHCGQPSLQWVFLWRVTFWRCRDPDELVGLPKVT